MAQYRITTDRGIVTLEGPEDATQEELEEAVNSHFEAGEAPAEAPVGGAEAEKVATIPQIAGRAVKSIVSAPIRAAKEVLTNPLKMAAETPILPLGGAIAAGPAGGAAGEGLRQVASIARGAPAPSPIQSAFQMAGAAIVPGTGKAVAKTVGTGIRVAKALRAPGILKAEEELLKPALRAANLDKIDPLRFTKAEAEQGLPVQYAKKTLNRLQQLAPEQLQELRSTINNLFRNRIVNPNSPDGQVLSQAAEAAGNRLGEVNPAVGAGLRALRMAYQAEPTKKAVKKAVKNAVRLALTSAAVGAGVKLGFPTRAIIGQVTQ